MKRALFPALCLAAALLLSGCQSSPAAQNPEDTPVEESLGTYYQEAQDQTGDDPVLASTRTRPCCGRWWTTKSRPRPPWPGWTPPPSRTGGGGLPAEKRLS